jgi:hypothetical protein
MKDAQDMHGAKQRQIVVGRPSWPLDTTSLGAILAITRSLCTKFYVSTVGQNRTKVVISGFSVRPLNH